MLKSRICCDDTGHGVVFVVSQMGITSRDQTTPVLLFRNISQHLSGTARTIGAALVGRYGTLHVNKYIVTTLSLG